MNGLRRLVLKDFRSYPALDLIVTGQTVVVTGENGSGKTNLLEAVSLFAQGRGLRRADLAACARNTGPGGFAVSIEVATSTGLRQFGTGFDPAAAGDQPSRRYRVDREPAGSARAFADDLRLVWLTPAMDGLFNASPGERRRFLDRLVLAVDAEHGARVAALERALRQRNRVLEDGSRADGAWLDAIERELAELAVAVAAARADTVARLSARMGLAITDRAVGRRDSAFPDAEVALAGDIEAWCAAMPALEVEDRYRGALRANRGQDAAARRTLLGPQTTDLLVRHAAKGLAAASCSTGEQKALLVTLVLAHAKLVADTAGIVPVILLDEVAAHFDAARRAALLAALAALPSQVWMTGADAHAFAAVDAGAQWLRITPGRVEPMTGPG